MSFTLFVAKKLYKSTQKKDKRGARSSARFFRGRAFCRNVSVAKQAVLSLLGHPAHPCDGDVFRPL